MNFPAGGQNGFLLNEGFLDSGAAPLSMDLRNGLDVPFVLPDEYQSRYDRRMEFLKAFDTSRTVDTAWAPKRFLEWESFTRSAHKMLKSPEIGKIFQLTGEERNRYGSNAFGDACLIARNMVYLSQVQSTVRYSRKLAALGRLSAGVAHEVKNPLNAMAIHLELLRQQFEAAGARRATGAARARNVRAEPDGRAVAIVAAAEPVIDRGQALQHVDVIANEIRRLDEVVQGFLKFSRPEDLKLQPVDLAALVDEMLAIVRPEAERANVTLVVECDNVPDVDGDPAMLRQAFLNLAQNAVQGMPNGGTLRIHGESARGRRASITFSDTGVGIKPEHLQKIFDLYFTTKEKGSGIGLSMVFRTVQMHDGDIEVESTPGAGTTFRVLLPRA
jgi:signal transduction histidine kinase